MLKIKNAPVSLYKMHPPFTAWSINTGNILQRTTTIKCIIHLKHFEALYQFDAGKNILYKMMKYGALEGAFYRRQSLFSIKWVPNEHFIDVKHEHFIEDQLRGILKPCNSALFLVTSHEHIVKTYQTYHDYHVYQKTVFYLMLKH